MSEEKYVTIKSTIHHATARAVQFSTPSLPDEKLWIPRSCIHTESDQELHNNSNNDWPLQDFNLQIVEWLAKKHGLG